MQLKDVLTLRVRFFITGQQGRYRFNGLKPNHDYEVQALYKSHRSEVKRVSVFDGRSELVIDLSADLTLRPAVA